MGPHVPRHKVLGKSWKMSTMCEGGGTVVIRNIQFRVLEVVVRFIYSGIVEVNTI